MDITTQITDRERLAVYYHEDEMRGRFLGCQSVVAAWRGDADRAYWMARWAVRMANARAMLATA